MAGWFQDIMNLDLNLGPVAPTIPDVEPGIELEPTSGESRDVDSWGRPLQQNVQDVLRRETRHREQLRWRQLQVVLEQQAVRLAVETNANRSDIGTEGEGEDGGGTLQVGEGSVAPEERSGEVLKMCENNVTLVESGSVEEKEDVEKTGTDGGGFFDCNICLDLSREPIVTCCGHLFCWSCIYQWLHIHSDAKECPVCKGEVTLKNVTPIYGRGTHTRDSDESDIKIPARPSATRVESLRQTIQRTASLFPMEEMIRRLGARFELNQDFYHLPSAELESEQRSGPSLSSIMTTRARRREQASALASEDAILNRMMTLQREQLSGVPPENVVDLTQDRPEAVPPRRVPTPLTYRRGQSHRSDAAGVTPTDRILEAFFRRSSTVRSQEIQPSSVDDRDSFSSIAAVDTAVEIDSLVSLSTSSSRRHDVSRSSDMDSGDSRAPRRRRFN